MLLTTNGQVITLKPVTTVLQTVVPVSSTNNPLSGSTTTLVSTSADLSTNLNVQSSSSSVLLLTTLSTVPVSTRYSSTFDFEPKTSTVDGAAGSTSSKTGLIVGLSIGIPIFIVLLAGAIYYLFCTFKAKPQWKNSPLNLGYKDESSFVKKFKVISKIKTPKQAYNISEPRKSTWSWKKYNSPPAEKINFHHKEESNDSDDYSDGSEKKLRQASIISKEFKTLSTPNENIIVNKFLYESPPKIKKISSQISLSDNSLSTRIGKKVPHQLQLDDISKFEDPQSKWTYRSPLSKWFLRDSTYLEPSQSTTPLDQTLSVDLKTLQLPSDKRKQTNYSFAPPVSKAPGRKHLIDINALSEKRYLDKSLPALPFKTESRISLLEGEFTKNTQHPKALYRVIRDYHPQFLDELEIYVGEHVVVLSIHSDGWALVANNVEDLKYSDDSGCKGIVPMGCLEKVV